MMRRARRRRLMPGVSPRGTRHDAPGVRDAHVSICRFVVAVARCRDWGRERKQGWHTQHLAANKREVCSTVLRKTARPSARSRDGPLGARKARTHAGRHTHTWIARSRNVCRHRGSGSLTTGTPGGLSRFSGRKCLGQNRRGQRLPSPQAGLDPSSATVHAQPEAIQVRRYGRTKGGGRAGPYNVHRLQAVFPFLGSLLETGVIVRHSAVPTGISQHHPSAHFMTRWHPAHAFPTPSYTTTSPTHNPTGTGTARAGP